MTREWKGILSRYGQRVTLRQGEKAVQLRALVQPVLEESRPQAEPTPLGLGRQERFLYLGPAEHPLGRDTLVEWQGERFRVQRAHLAGGTVCPYWWAVLCPGDKEATA